MSYYPDTPTTGVSGMFLIHIRSFSKGSKLPLLDPTSFYSEHLIQELAPG
nr:MAG TPA: hypothetical protein [Bacteriophage sp.]